MTNLRIYGVLLALTLVFSYACIRQDIETEEYAEMIEFLFFYQKYTLVKGIVDSPSVIIYIDNYKEFDMRVQELNNTVYYEPSDRMIPRPQYMPTYYVFNDEMTIAWGYTPILRSGRPFAPYRWVNQ